jgi:hypothetical protein
MEEYKRIFDYFELSTDEKANKLGEVFEDSIEFFQRFRHVLKTGSPEEKASMLKLVHELKDKIQSEVGQICKDTGLTQEQLETASVDPNLYTEEQWEIIQDSKAKIEEQSRLISDYVRTEEGPGASLRPKAERGKKPKKKKKWVKS